MPRRPLRPLLAILQVAILLLATATAPAQDGPFFANDRVVVVANASSPLSLALAYRYAALRHIPPEHVLALDDVPGSQSDPTPVPAVDACERILRPLAHWLADAGLTDEIDCIAYSIGFPHGVDVSSEPRSKGEYIGGVAALTGLTTFLRQTKDRDFACLAFDANPFAAQARAEVQGRGFGADPGGRGRCYQSVMLGWSGAFGLGFAETLAQLERAAAADGTRPDGTVYLLDNADVRSTTRKPLFARTQEELQKRGRKVAVLAAGDEGGQTGVLPVGKSDVVGAVVGIADFDWDKSGSTLLPGAIAEHLTSFGATFQTGGQTKLTAFLRAGAAASAGTVTEPYALQAKFPTPLLHVYYADGCSLAEAFHQSVSGPYQLLIVGDACCRPFATTLPFALPPLPETWTGTVALQPAVDGAVRFEAWIDGVLAGTGAVAATLEVDTTRFADGPHELHLVAIGVGPVEVPTAIAAAIRVDNFGLAATLQPHTQKPLVAGDVLTLQGRVPVGATYELRSGAQVLDRGQSPRGEVRILVSTARLAFGETPLRLVGEAGGHRFASPIVRITTTPAPALTASPDPQGMLPGLALDVRQKRGSTPQRIGTLAAGDAMDVPAEATATVRGAVFVAEGGLHEWTCGHGDLLGLTLDGAALVKAKKGLDVTPGHGLVLDLAAGWHLFDAEVAGTPGSAPRLSLTGPRGAVGLDARSSGQEPFAIVPLAGLAPKLAAFCDGNRKVIVEPPDGEAEVQFAAPARVAAVLVYFHGLSGDVDELPKTVAVELSDGRGWQPLRATDLRVLRGGTSEPGITCLLAVPGRKAKQLRIRGLGKATAIQHLTEIEVRAAR